MSETKHSANENLYKKVDKKYIYIYIARAREKKSRDLIIYDVSKVRIIELSLEMMRLDKGEKTISHFIMKTHLEA